MLTNSLQNLNNQELQELVLLVLKIKTMNKEISNQYWFVSLQNPLRKL